MLRFAAISTACSVNHVHSVLLPLLVMGMLGSASSVWFGRLSMVLLCISAKVYIFCKGAVCAAELCASHVC